MDTPTKEEIALLEGVLKVVARDTGVPVHDICSDKRGGSDCGKARRIVYWVMYKLLKQKPSSALLRIYMSVGCQRTVENAIQIVESQCKLETRPGQCALRVLQTVRASA